MRNVMRIAILGLGLLAVSAAGLRAEDWPRWRGAYFNGVSSETGWVAAWPQEGPRRLWTANVSTGFCSVAIKAGRLFTLGNSNHTDTVWAFDAERGHVLWKYSYPCKLDPNFYEGGPSATPTVNLDRVYTLSKEGLLLCFRAASGQVLWRKHLVTDFGVKRPEWGFSGSPTIVGEQLVLNAGGAGLAVHKITGELLWCADKGPCAYASPLPVTVAGKHAYCFLSHQDLIAVGVDGPSAGAVLWRHPWKTSYDMSVPDAVVRRNLLYVSSFGQPGTLFDLSTPEPQQVWQCKDFWQHISTPVLVKGYLYGFHGDATKGNELKCVDFATGQVKWTEANLPNGGLTAAGGKLIVLTGNGELIVADASPAGFKPISRAQVLGGKCWTMPVLANRLIYCRNARGDLVCLDVRPKSP